MPAPKHFPPLSDAERDLADRNRGLAFHALRRFHRMARRLGDEALSVAYVGLLVGVRHYDPARGALSTIVTRAVRSQLMEALRGRECRCRDRRRTKRFAYYRDGDMIHEPAARGPTPDVVAERLDVPVVLRKVAAAAGRRGYDVLRQRYLLGRQLEEIGADLGVTKQYVEQVSKKAAARARQLAW